MKILVNQNLTLIVKKKKNQRILQLINIKIYFEKWLICTIMITIIS